MNIVALSIACGINVTLIIGGLSYLALIPAVLILRRHVPKEVKFQMLLRGQNLVGYRNYADDVAEAFVDQSCEAGIEIFRIFDALNDERNFETAARAALTARPSPEA